VKVSASAPGKLILLGEYAVLEGAPALAMAVNRFAQVILDPISLDHCLLDAPEIGISDLPFTLNQEEDLSFLTSISEKVEKRLSFFSSTLKLIRKIRQQGLSELPNFKIKLDTSQFFHREDSQKLGLGSSAAVTVGLISALLQFGDNDFNPMRQSNQIFEAALRSHRNAQENIGSGIDVAASVFGGILKYKIQDPEFSIPPFHEKLTIQPDLHILIIWTGKSASTSQFVRKVKAFKQTKSKDFERIINRMSAMSNSGIEAYAQKNISGFMEAIKQYSAAMKYLGEKSGIPIVSKIHQIISEIVIDGGGVYKPSGAGGGDLGIAFCKTIGEKEKIFHKLEDAGFDVLNLEIATKGIQVETM
jgi:phosphomevalonate kinase